VVPADGLAEYPADYAAGHPAVGPLAPRLAELVRWLRIPSISGDPARAGDLRRAAAFLAAALRRAGATVGLVELAGLPPAVLGYVRGPAGAPVLLLYGHYDVRPPGPGWTSDPFRPVLRGGRLIARGADDDKGQLYAGVAALHAWRAVGGPPCTVVVLAEGAEEIGSPGLDRVLAALARRLTPDLVLACDTERAPDGVPTVTVSQRGHAVLDVAVDTGGPAVHAGRFGGAVIDPSFVLARILVELRRALDRMAAGAPARSCGAPVLERSDAVIRRAAGGRATHPIGLDHRITRRAALTVVDLAATGPGGSVPSLARARLDVRTPPGVPVRAAVSTLRRALALTALPPGVRLRLDIGPARPGLASCSPPAALGAATRACRAVFGAPPRLVRSGGSLPAAAMLARQFTPPLLLGLGTPGGGAHGPDEHLDIAGWSRAVSLLVRLLGEPLGAVRPVSAY
jgi:acetylornithine deacetylase/succinyl-diaminopimelate desuccinylase-like protein